jgi:hypothetical protein
MIDLGPCEITAVIGPMASGKTFLINQWLKAGQNRYVRFDATGETCENLEVQHVWQNPAQLWARLKENPYYFRLAYHPGSDLQVDFEWALKCLWRLNVYKLIVCDEFHEVCGVNDTPGYVKTMMRYARHAHLGLIGASQRLADVHKLFTGGARRVILFRNDDARDVDAVRDRWGRECAEMFINLRPLIYDDVTKVTKQIPQCIVIPRGGKPQIFDFAKDAYVSSSVAVGPGSDSNEAEIQCEGSSGSGEEQPFREQTERDDESQPTPES